MRDLDDPAQCSGASLTENDLGVPPLLTALRAAQYAARHHAGQPGKGSPPAPYVNHLIEVAHLVVWAAESDDPALVAAALLHDVVEKTPVTDAELRASFGDEIADLVAELTDDTSLSEEAQRQAQIEHAPHLTPRAKLIKLADKTSNLRAHATEPAATWPTERKAEQLRWTLAVADGCRGVSARLDQAFDAAVEAFSRLGEDKA